MLPLKNSTAVAVGLVEYNCSGGEMHLKTRLITAAVGLVVLAVVMGFFHTPIFELVLCGITLIALGEIYKALQLESGAKMIFAGAVPYVAAVMFSGVLGIEPFVWLITFAFVLYMVICLVRHSQTLNFTKLCGWVLFGGIILLCFYSFAWMKQMMPKDGLYIVFLVLGFAWGGDSAAYFAGRFFGKHKLAPVVSPNKTIEGAVGGVIGSVIMGVLITMAHGAISGGDQALGGITTTHYWIIAVLGVISSLLGILGDLFASAVKRQCGIKDYGYIFPGHGGIMDRFDSVLFISPCVALGIVLAFYQ